MGKGGGRDWGEEGCYQTRAVSLGGEGMAGGSTEQSKSKTIRLFKSKVHTRGICFLSNTQDRNCIVGGWGRSRRQVLIALSKIMQIINRPVETSIAQLSFWNDWQPAVSQAPATPIQACPCRRRIECKVRSKPVSPCPRHHKTMKMNVTHMAACQAKSRENFLSDRNQFFSPSIPEFPAFPQISSCRHVINLTRCVRRRSLGGIQ